MPGRAFLRKISRIIEDFGGDEWFMGRIMAGDRMADIASDIAKRNGGKCSRQFLYTWIKAGGEERKAAYKEARRISAYELEDEGRDILDTADDSTASSVTLATSRAKYRQWQASVRNREEHGEKGAEVNVNLSVGSLHLDALRLRAPGRAVGVPVEPAGELAPVEVVE